MEFINHLQFLLSVVLANLTSVFIQIKYLYYFTLSVQNLCCIYRADIQPPLLHRLHYNEIYTWEHAEWMRTLVSKLLWPIALNPTLHQVGINWRPLQLTTSVLVAICYNFQGSRIKLHSIMVTIMFTGLLANGLNYFSQRKMCHGKTTLNSWKY